MTLLAIGAPFSFLIVCLLTFPSAQSAVYESLFGTPFFVSLRQYILHLSVVIMDCTQLYLASALGVFCGGHARCDVFLYPYSLLLCVIFVIMECMQLYLTPALGVFYGSHARRDVHPSTHVIKKTDRHFPVFCSLVVIDRDIQCFTH